MNIYWVEMENIQKHKIYKRHKLNPRLRISFSEKTDLISTNMPDYEGDTGEAWISFRSIDSFAMLEWSTHLDQEDQEKLVNSVVELIEHGQLLPQVARELPSNERDLDFEASTVGVFGRASSPSEIPEVIWIHTLLKH